MSHFTVLVIGQDPERQLAPYHEFECTGVVDEFVQSIDLTAEKREDYESDTRNMVKVPAGVVVPDGTRDLVSHPAHGTLVSRYASMFYVETGEKDPLGGARRTFQLPEGYEEIEVPVRELMTFLEYVTEDSESEPIGENVKPDLEGAQKWGWVRVDAAGEVLEVIDRTNPNKKWDWHVLGGRWTGFFKMKPHVRGIQGRPGLMTSPAKEGYADSAFKMDIDFEGMRAEAEAKAAEKFDAIRAIIEPHLPVQSWAEVRGQYWREDGAEPELPGGIEAAREAYREQPAVKALRECEKYTWENAEDYAGDRATYIRHQGIRSSMTFAVVKDGKWYERGSMGWWGCVSDEKDQGAWIEEFGKLVEGLPDDTLLSVYDCHI
jgi:hypothetical protein